MRFLAIALLAGVATAATAHAPSDSYLRLQVDDTEVSGRWDIAVVDLHALLNLDANSDGAITWGELLARRSAIAETVLPKLRVRTAQATCALRLTELRVVDHVGDTYAALDLNGNCPTTPMRLMVGYDLLFDLNASHRALLNLRFGGTHSTVLGPNDRWQTFERGAVASGDLFLRYLGEGARHIWAGLDHMLFLFCLLMPAVLRRERGEWRAAPDGRRAFVDLVKIVTAFTVAHACSLTAASLEWLRPPTRWVEVAVATTIVLAAVNNLRPLLRLERLPLVAFGFGLIHGAGYAGVLGGLGLPTGTLALALLGFNLGVEGGQILVAAAVMPLAFAARRQAWYRHGVVVPGSVLIALLAGLWLVRRLLNIRIEGLW